MRRLGQQTLRKQNYRHLSCEYMRQVSSHVLSCAPLSLLAASARRGLTTRAVLALAGAVLVPAGVAASALKPATDHLHQVNKLLHQTYIHC